MKLKQEKVISFVLLIAMSMMLLIPVYATDIVESEKQALALKKLGLFKGVSETDFDLGRAPTRTEALVMLIRVLGKENEVLNTKWIHPFKDVEPWADKFIGYAYENGLTRGISATELGTGNANSDMYMTFVLRALGYDDSKGDFDWKNPNELAKSTGILPSNVDTKNFLRADVALVSWAALKANIKNDSKTLSEKLIAANVFTTEEYNTAKQIANELPTENNNDQPTNMNDNNNLPAEKSNNNETVPVKDDSGTGNQTINDGKIIVSTFDALCEAVKNVDISEININSDIDITKELSFERGDNGVKIYIEKGKTLTVSNTFCPVGGSIVNEGTIIITGTFERGICNFTNNGSVVVKSGGKVSSGMSDTDNNGTFSMDDGSNMLIERGTLFNNFGTLKNNGNIIVRDGGQLNYRDGSMVNNGTIDLYSYFNGDITKISGTGKLNDKRE